jgi:hypothetical protein
MLGDIEVRPTNIAKSGSFSQLLDTHCQTQVSFFSAAGWHDSFPRDYVYHNTSGGNTPTYLSWMRRGLARMIFSPGRCLSSMRRESYSQNGIIYRPIDVSLEVE